MTHQEFRTKIIKNLPLIKKFLYYTGALSIKSSADDSNFKLTVKETLRLWNPIVWVVVITMFVFSVIKHMGTLVYEIYNELHDPYVTTQINWDSKKENK